MAAGAWTFYNAFKNRLGTAGVDLSGASNVFQMRLFQSASNVNDATLSTLGSATSEVATGGYAARTLTVNWSVGATVSIMSWLYNTVIWTVAAGSAMANVRFAVIVQQTASLLVCFSELSSAEFEVAAGNLYVIEPNPVAFTLNSS